jgi:hypothetical protein
MSPRVDKSATPELAKKQLADSADSADSQNTASFRGRRLMVRPAIVL